MLLGGDGLLHRQLFLLEHALDHNTEDLLPHIAVPTLIIAGDKDGFTPASCSVHMHESIPNSRLLMIENGNADWQNQDLPDIHTQFVVGDTLLVFFTDGAGANHVKQVEVVSSQDNTYGGTPAALVRVKAPYTQT